MKIIKLTESQFNKLIMEDDDAPTFNGGDVKEFGDPGEVSTTATIHDNDGNAIYGDEPTTDDIAGEICPQNFWMNGMFGSRQIKY